MLFNTLQFALFFALVWSCTTVAGPRRAVTILLAASLVFYALWVPAYLLLLLGTIGFNYALLRAMIAQPKRRSAYLVASVVGTLGLLIFFKYAAFLIEATLPVLRLAHAGWQPPVPDIALPLGISFYSFQIIAVAVDTYRGNLAPIRSLSRYTLFICFFPQLIAGPIVRGDELIPQLERGPALSPERNRRGVWLIACGLTKKIVFADYLLAPFVNAVFASPDNAPAPMLLVAAYSFAFQIYFDFSGYSDIARGLGLLLGFELPFNFKEPYLSRDPSEFWSRWHITLSSWLRDYLYIPLGGNRGTPASTSRNLMLTMLLGGLWHGASWTFVAWGGLHGLLLVVHRPFAASRGRRDAPFAATDALRVVALFHAVCLLWIFFRAPSLEVAYSMIANLAGGDFASAWPPFQMAVVALCAVLHPLERLARLRSSRLQGAVVASRTGLALEAVALGVLAALCLAASSGGEFIYFQF